MSNIVHKVKDALSGHHGSNDPTPGTTTHNTTTTHHSTNNPNTYSSGSTNAGPHNSNVANKLDPTVDSDLDGSRRVGGNTNTHGTSNTYGSTGTGVTGTHGTHSSTTGHGPHNSGVANKLDPTVDSTTGLQKNTGTTGTSGYSSTHNTHSGSVGGYGSGYNHSTNAGPHDSNIANKIDPRVDSDRDGSRTAGTTGTGYGNSGTYGSNNTGVTSGTGAYGAHGHGTTSGGLTGSNTKTTAGPHNSDFANKIDPRVDSDLDGSRTIGSGPNRGNY